MTPQEIQQDIIWIKDNWSIIPDKYKTYLKKDNYAKDICSLSLEEHFVILLLNRQKPSVVASYDFDEERIGVTKEGKIVWGFDSGCSCPSPWNDSYPECYKVSKSWKEFEVNLREFDKNVIEECLSVIDKIKKEVLALLEEK